MIERVGQHRLTGVLVHTLLDIAAVWGPGLAVWKTQEMLIPANWCGGTSPHFAILIGLLAMLSAGDTRTRYGSALRLNLVLSAILAAITTVATISALLAARIIAGCTSLSTLSGWQEAITGFIPAAIIGIAAVITFFVIAERLRSSVDEAPDTPSNDRERRP